MLSFHLHATSKDGNILAASASEGDKRSAASFCRNGLVITYLNETDEGTIRVNVDYYNRRGSTVDLGVYDTKVKIKR